MFAVGVVIKTSRYCLTDYGKEMHQGSSNMCSTIKSFGVQKCISRNSMAAYPGIKLLQIPEINCCIFRNSIEWFGNRKKKPKIFLLSDFVLDTTTKQVTFALDTTTKQVTFASLFTSGFQSWLENVASLRGRPCKYRAVDFRPKTEFLQIFRVGRQVHVKNKEGNNLAFNAIFQYFWRRFQRTVQNLKIVLFRVKFMRCAEGAEKLSFYSNTIKLSDHFISCFVF